jgi:hypothetical protein
MKSVHSQTSIGSADTNTAERQSAAHAASSIDHDACTQPTKPKPNQPQSGSPPVTAKVLEEDHAFHQPDLLYNTNHGSERVSLRVHLLLTKPPPLSQPTIVDSSMPATASKPTASAAIARNSSSSCI